MYFFHQEGITTIKIETRFQKKKLQKLTSNQTKNLEKKLKT